jgi:molecular chaperone GrpE
VVSQLPNNPAKKSPESTKKAETEPPAPLDEKEEMQDRLRKVTKQNEENERKAKEYLDRATRLQADMENLQKITKRQVDTMTRQASERLILRLLPSLDALREAERAANSGNSLPPEEIAVGLKMLEQQLSEALRSEGLEEIAAVGQPLDPERHEVVSYVESDEKPENTITEEIRRGYTLNGKVIRPSLVVVSRKPHVKDEEEVGGATK